jgi:hypothetical protein
MALTEARRIGVPSSVGFLVAAKKAALFLEISGGAFTVAETTGALMLIHFLELGMYAIYRW